ncbi:MAG: glycosyl transferase family 1 [Novosphingobium sp. 28-62-57]|uniref:glycosyltransferase family 4 protein n=1 Tax=unclassified Novosphingobium TaxID=2644732 RepID=UPI000BD0532A|nr:MULTISPECIES: glycosyltransferase family 4 protein [unclassified Novosphingobium]OYW48505.1 MAG: glycosyl transferase family 1 [Novosphingobium sp. 12-62-10]OYZ09353.1 MAG: glycosyl transferase family 1 [Novosphingobium sp. 28-62-57]OZA38644.1 MAG: glycosyl transferase family 1 [Novosphingobium sp. 17-62-9]HQS69714.1 glycosyltransferase family 4 protein [Novosphingobium sp.]
MIASNDASGFANAVAGDVLSFSRHPHARGGRRLALIGGFRPRKCGIATFTTDVYVQLGASRCTSEIDMHVIDGGRSGLVYEAVRSVIRADVAEDFIAAARTINADGVDAVWLQHEYGIFGGEAGAMVLELVDRVAAPLIVTLHTVLAEPSPAQRRVLEHILRRASRIMVMSRHAAWLLKDVHQVDPNRIVVIPHGAPDRPFGRSDEFKARAGLTGRKVMMTFGLLSHGKGLETVIEALPAIVARHPDALYRIVGATHPNLLDSEGEAYRESLIALAAKLGVADHVEWDNRFVGNDELLDQLEACDVYLTPYPNLQQSTSGTLSYAVALGKAVVSTPYVHARELLDDGVGILVEPHCGVQIAHAVNGLFDDPGRLHTMQRRAWEKGRETIWPRFAAATQALVESVVARPVRPMPLLATPGFAGVTAMSDATGMLQHAIGTIPDRRHGYCLDDNVRALMLMGVADAVPLAERQRWATVYAAFIQYAWNPDVGLFRNFMNYERTWCESIGSEDSNGRAIWALGGAMNTAPDDGMRAWAAQWFDITLPSVAALKSPRTIAFTMLGCVEALKANPAHEDARTALMLGGAELCRLHEASRSTGWDWFEAGLGYDNARMAQALIAGAGTVNNDEWLERGLASLAFLAGQQKSAQGHFRPVGSDTFGKSHEAMPFDQQPVEAWAAVEAGATAWAATGDEAWLNHAEMAYRWFLGSNDRGVVLADFASGRCRDGVTPQGVNLNCGAESILAFQLAHYALCGLRKQTGSQNVLGQNVLGQGVMGQSVMGQSALGQNTGEPAPAKMRSGEQADAMTKKGAHNLAGA